jgi:hypothetical protein
MKRHFPVIDVGQQLLSFARDERPAPPPAPRFAVDESGQAWIMKTAKGGRS